MKYNLYRDLLPEHSLMSHVFLNTVAENKEYFDKFEKIPNEQKKNKTVEVDISMTVDGIEVDPSKFFQLIYDQYERQVKSHAKELFQQKMAGQFEDKINDLQYRLGDISEVLKSWEKEINWEVKNPFKD